VPEALAHPADLTGSICLVILPSSTREFLSLIMDRKCRIIFFLLLVVAAVGLTGCEATRDLSEEDRLARKDDKGADTGKKPEEGELFPDTPIGQKLRNHMNVLTLPAETLEEADSRYAKSLGELRKDPKEVIKLLAEAYRNIEENRYFERWGLVKTLGDLRNDEAYTTLSSIAKSAIPVEKSEDLHHFSTQEEEQIIRLPAVEGLAALASQGHKAAERDLLNLAVEPLYPYFAVKKRAIKGYLKAGRDTKARIRFLKSKLPLDLHEIVTLEVTSPEEFQAKVRELTSVSPDETTKDTAEEQLPKEPAPAVK
jgi:hypothetical protein